MNGRQIRQKRAASGIPGAVLSNRVGIARSRLSDIERGHVQPSDEELQRLTSALDQLVSARKKVEEVAAEVRYPL